VSDKRTSLIIVLALTIPLVLLLGAVIIGGVSGFFYYRSRVQAEEARAKAVEEYAREQRERERRELEEKKRAEDEKVRKLIEGMGGSP
jgi:hypothetical protein